jgi:tetratricopeptide (TPR) repeat protein
VSGEEGEQIFTVVDRLAVEIRDDLSLPAAAKAEEDRPVADVTTHSPEAYRYYLEGLEYDSKVLYDNDAEESYRKALEFDSTFAMAYYRLAQHTSREESNRLLAKAAQYSARASWREQHSIRAAQLRAAGDTEGAIQELRKIIERYPEDKETTRILAGTYHNREEYEEALRYYERAIEIDPLYELVYNTLAYLYDYLGDHDKSIWAINKYIALAPDEANPYDTRGDLYRSEGKIDQAAQSYRKAVELKPDSYFSLKKLGHMYLFKREYSRAESCYQRLAASTDQYWRSAGRTYLADVSIYQGKFEEALTVLDDAIAADRMEKYEGRPNRDKYWRRIRIYEVGMKNLNLAIKDCEKVMELYSGAVPDAKFYGRGTYARLLVWNGDFQQAEEVATTLRESVDEKVEWQVADYRRAMGGIEWARGNYEGSQVISEKIPEEYRNPPCRYILGEACLMSGRLGEAVESFEKVLSDYSDVRASEAIWVVKAHYLLGRAYEESGWDKKAVEQYEEFLEIWKDADPGIPEIEDARQRLVRLKSGA